MIAADFSNPASVQSAVRKELSRIRKHGRYMFILGLCVGALAAVALFWGM